MDSRILQLPPSYTAAIMALAAFAYVVAPVDTLTPSVPRASKRTADRLRKTTGALVAVLEEFEKARRDGAAMVDQLSASTSGAERMTEALDAFKRARDRVLQAAQMVEAAVVEAAPHATALNRAIRGWSEAVSKLKELIPQLRDELRKADDGRLDSLRQTAGEILVRSLAAVGFDEWVAALPMEEEPAFDEADVRPIYWDETQGGWVGGAR